MLAMSIQQNTGKALYPFPLQFTVKAAPKADDHFKAGKFVVLEAGIMGRQENKFVTEFSYDRCLNQSNEVVKLYKLAVY